MSFGVHKVFILLTLLVSLIVFKGIYHLTVFHVRFS